MMSDSMKAVRMHEFGGDDVLALEDVPRPDTAKAHAHVAGGHRRGKVVVEI